MYRVVLTALITAAILAACADTDTSTLDLLEEEFSSAQVLTASASDDGNIGIGHLCRDYTFCNVEGLTRCSEDILQECGPNANGCFTWHVLQDCREINLTCIGSRCVPICISDCELVGNQRCGFDINGNSTIIETCDEILPNCYRWTETMDCLTEVEGKDTCVYQQGNPVCE